MPCVDGVKLTRISNTCLYLVSGGAALVFLRWSTQAAPPSLALEDVWANSGPPPTLGYLVFLKTVPVVDPPGFEQDLRDLLPAPDDNGFVWAANSPTQVQTLLSIAPNVEDVPCVDGDTELATLPGRPRVGFSDRSPVIAEYREGCLVSFGITYPPMAGAEPPRGLGVTLPMTGNYVGCVTFSGLVDKLGATPPDSTTAVKTRVLVSIDPLHPLDTTRNRQTFTDQDYYLTEDGGVYRLSIAP
jgi:hypothetical protein